MADDEHEPELAGYEPGDGRPLRSPHMLRTMRILVVLGVIALILPGIVTTVSVSASTAQASCELWVDYKVAGDSGADTRFELFGEGGMGWQCYAVGAFGGDRHIAPLGLIPGAPHLPGERPLNS